ncbi:MAG: hypothetical protein H0U59_12205 [Gemmatimonadaceae bacterium]|nr:hypothetical protein [Gemmatimonadaceae bacterium]
MPAPYDDVYDAIKAHIDANWDASLAAMYMENEFEGEPTTDVGLWVLWVLDTSLYGQQSIGGGIEPGQNRWDEDGTLWFHIFAPKGVGSRESRRIAKALANLFRGRLLLNDDLEFHDADMGAGDPGRENGNYFLMSVSIDWRRTEAQ